MSSITAQVRRPREDIQQLCKASGLKLESYEVRKGFRLHCVVRKEEDASL